MLEHYIEYLESQVKELNRKGIRLSVNVRVSKYDIQDCVKVLEEYYIMNGILTKTGGTKYIPSRYIKTPMSYLKDRIYSECESEWLEESEKLIRQPEDAGIISKNVEDVQDFIKRLGLRSEDDVEEQGDTTIMYSGLNTTTGCAFVPNYSAVEFDYDSDTEDEYEEEEVTDYDSYEEEEVVDNYDSDEEEEVTDYDSDEEEEVTDYDSYEEEEVVDNYDSYEEEEVVDNYDSDRKSVV